jgi:hypothetical protein
MIRWLRRILVGAAMLFIALYGGDWAIYLLRGSPTSKVTVNRLMVVPLKGNKNEYDYLGSSDEPCSESLFPRGGQSPCWRLRRNVNQITNL